MRIFYRLAYPTLLVFIFFGLPNSILYSQGIMGWIPFILIMFVQPFLLYKMLNSFGAPDPIEAIAIPLSILVVGPLFGIYSNNVEEKRLRDNGAETKGIVHEKQYQSWKNKGWFIKCNFEVDAKTYSTFNITDKHNKYQIGDTLTIRYYKKFPQQCIIKELENDK